MRGPADIPTHGEGQLSPERLRPGQWQVGQLVSKTDPGAVVTVYFDQEAVSFVECTRAVFVAGGVGRAALSARGGGSRPTCFLPPYIRLPVDDKGNLVLPRFRVTSVVERRHV